MNRAISHPDAEPPEQIPDEADAEFREAEPQAPTPASAVMVRRNDAKEAYRSIEAAVEAKQDEILKALVPSIDPKRFLAVGLQAVTRTPRLLESTPASIVKALMDAAELGLEPSGLLGSAYLVPYKNKRTGRYEAQLIPGYRGLIDLARRSGEVRTIEARVVRERDDFAYQYGTDQFLRHVPYVNLDGARDPDWVDERGETRPGKLQDGGRYTHTYALARLASGEVQFMVRDMPFIEGIRRRSKAADDGPWVTDYEAMASKTMARQLLKYLPLSVRLLQRALELEELAESGAAPPPVAASPARKALAESLLDDDAEGEDASGE